MGMNCAVKRDSSIHLLRFFAVTFAVATYFLFCLPASAQMGIGAEGFSLDVRPSLPEPHMPVTISLNDYSVNAISAEVFWSVNGRLQEDSKNARSITLETGDLGEKNTVEVTLRRGDGTELRASTVIEPTVVDLVLEADTYVPSFYQGRALPGRTSMLHATAVVHDSTGLLDTAYTYRWTLGQEVLFGGAVKGKNTVSFAMPLYSKTLTVEVIGPEGKVIARKSMTPTGVQPELYFYEWSPLRGLYQDAISGAFPLIGEENTIYGEPYFVNTSPTSANANVAWNIGGQVVSSDPESARAITVTRDLLGTGDTIELQILTRDKVPQLLKSSFNVIAY